jgi:hypothetical protein
MSSSQLLDQALRVPLLRPHVEHLQVSADQYPLEDHVRFCTKMLPIEESQVVFSVDVVLDSSSEDNVSTSSNESPLPRPSMQSKKKPLQAYLHTRTPAHDCPVDHRHYVVFTRGTSILGEVQQDIPVSSLSPASECALVMPHSGGSHIAEVCAVFEQVSRLCDQAAPDEAAEYRFCNQSLITCRRGFGPGHAAALFAGSYAPGQPYAMVTFVPKRGSGVFELWDELVVQNVGLHPIEYTHVREGALQSLRPSRAVGAFPLCCLEEVLSVIVVCANDEHQLQRLTKTVQAIVSSRNSALANHNLGNHTNSSVLV